MESTGERLKTARELRKLSLEEAAKFTKIRQRFLRAIEEDRYDLLPPSFYVKGFLTIYAKYLGLNPNDVVFQYQSNPKTHATLQPLELQQQVPPLKKRNWPLRFLFLIFAIIISAAVFIFLRSNQPSKWSPPPFPSAQAPLSTPEQREAQTIQQAGQKEISTSREFKMQEATDPEGPPLEILEASTGTGIEDKGGVLIMTGKSSELICNDQRAYFLTRIKTQKEGKIAHVWLWEGKEFYRREIQIRSPACSVYSYLTLRPQHAGNWKAEVRDGNHVLKSLSLKAAAVGSYRDKGKD